MRKLAFIFIIACASSVSFSSLAQTEGSQVALTKNQALVGLLLKNESASKRNYEKLVSTISTLKERRGKFQSDQAYLQHIYKYVHRKVLRNYKQYVSLSETLSKAGNYDCLTGTLIYSLVLDELGFDFTIREFNYHVLLIVEVENKQIMIESTDPYNGYVLGLAAIEARINRYKEEDAARNRKSQLVFSETLDNKINLVELTGLHFYNQAINYLNQKKIVAASAKINKAYSLYPGERIKEVSTLIKQGTVGPTLAVNQ